MALSRARASLQKLRFLHAAGTCCKQLLPSRWRRGPTRSDVMELQPNELEQSTPPETPPAVFRGQEARRGEESRRAMIVEPHFPLRAEREAAAATVGVDEGTYNLLMDMQHRDITPDDYEMLRSLDTSVKPKTLSPRTLELAAPCWEIPDICVPGTCVPGAGAASPLSAAEQQCSICMEGLLAGERVRRLPCMPARSTRPGPASTQRARGPPACSTLRATLCARLERPRRRPAQGRLRPLSAANSAPCSRSRFRRLWARRQPHLPRRVRRRVADAPLQRLPGRRPASVRRGRLKRVTAPLAARSREERALSR